MQWFSVLEWATWLMLILVCSKPVIWCCILETVLELEMCKSTLLSVRYICSFHIPAGACVCQNSCRCFLCAKQIFILLTLAAFVDPFAKWGWPGQQGRDFPGTTDLPAFQCSCHRGSCQLTLGHPLLGETLCEATRRLPSCMNLFSDRCLCESQETRCEAQTQVRLRVKNCGHVIRPDQVFRTSQATSGSLWEQATDLFVFFAC